MNDNTLLYWVSLEELNLLNNIVINAIDHYGTKTNETKATLMRIHTELSVSQTRGDSSIFPTNIMLSVLNLPSESIAIRLSNKELKVLETLPLTDILKERLK